MYGRNFKINIDAKNRTNLVNKNGRPMLKGECAVCGITKTQFVKDLRQGAI